MDDDLTHTDGEYNIPLVHRISSPEPTSHCQATGLSSATKHTKGYGYQELTSASKGPNRVDNRDSNGGWFFRSYPQ